MGGTPCRRTFPSPSSIAVPKLLLTKTPSGTGPLRDNAAALFRHAPVAGGTIQP